jgi:hypothetical protein
VVVECDGQGNPTDKLEDPWAIEADLGSQLRQRRGLGRARIVG